jgi:hypothetical protein
LELLNLNGKIEYREQRGYIALMSAIIISSLLLVISVSLGTSGFFSRFNVLETESKQKSQSLAEGCLQAAILRWAIGSTNTLVNINIGGDTCTIVSVKNNFPVAGQITILTKGSFSNADTNITAVIKNTDLLLVSIINS